MERRPIVEAQAALARLWHWCTGAAARRRWRIALALAAVAVAALSFVPPPPDAPEIGWDKANHFAAFAVIAALASLALRAPQRRDAVAAAGTLAYGVFIEAVQSQIPRRSAEVLDVVADAIGIAVGIAAVRWLQRRGERDGS